MDCMYCVYWLAILFETCLCPWQTFPLPPWLVFSLFWHHLSRSRIVWSEPSPASQFSPSWAVPVANLRIHLHTQRHLGFVLCHTLGVYSFRFYSSGCGLLGVSFWEALRSASRSSCCLLMLASPSAICWKDCLCSIILPLFFCQKSIDCVYVGVLGALCDVPSIYLSILSLVPLYVGYYSFTVSLEIQQCKPYNFILLLQ